MKAEEKPSIAEQKRDLRHKMRSLTRHYFQTTTPQERAQTSESLCRAIAEEPHYRAAQTVLLFYPLSDEIDIKPLLTDKSRLLLLPVIAGDTLYMRAYRGEAEMQREARFGVGEPTGANVEDQKPDVAIVPGLAFDKDGYRLGRGKGYYDRLLARLPDTYTIGVGFQHQFLTTVPHEAHDARLQTILAPNLKPET